MQAFVFMGEYSSACVCDAPGRAAQAGRSAATVAVAVAVMKQLRDSRDDVCMEQDCGRFGD
jgi:hypothetical protein